jgi:hypothetical protein
LTEADTPPPSFKEKKILDPCLAITALVDESINFIKILGER